MLEINETHTAELMAHLLREFLIHKRDPDERLKVNYTAQGCEAGILFKGQFYKITVEPMP